MPIPSMWNSSVHAMCDVDMLAYDIRVPEGERILPANLGLSDQSFEPRVASNPILPNIPDASDVSWNRVGTGRGRGALLMNRDMAHRNDEELRKQLRLATGLGNSNALIESHFNSSSSQEEDGAGDFNCATDDLTQFQHKVKNLVETTNKDDDTGTEQNGSDEYVSVKNNWDWEPRAMKPAPSKKNVALTSLERHRKKAKAPEIELSGHTATVCLDNFKPTPQVSSETKVKEDWRAENKAAEEARAKKTKGWRSQGSEPLLGDLKIEGNWSMFGPAETSPPPAAQDNLPIETAPKSLLDMGDTDIPRRSKKKKKGQNVRPMYVAPPESYREPDIAPAEFRKPINGVPPMALRNSEYGSPFGPEVKHATFNNMLKKPVQNLQQNGKIYEKKKNGFNLNNEEFPELK